MNNRANTNLGEEIKNIVQDALNNKDFKGLNQDVENVVKNALYEVRTTIKPKSRSYVTKQNNLSNYNKAPSPVKNSGKLSTVGTKYAVPVGQVSSILLTVFGSIGSTAFGIAVFVLTLLGFALGNFFHTIAIGLSPLLIVSAILLTKGISNRKRLKRFQKYMGYIKGRDYCPINELSAATGLSNKFIEKDLRKMISIGMFPQGHIDNKKTTFILTNECYKQYLEVQYLEVKKNIARKNINEGDRRKFLTTDKNYELNQGQTNKDGISSEMRKSLDEGRKFIADIKEANREIPGEEITRKLDRLEEIVGKIFDYVEIHPEKFTEIRKFTEYFLPTTFKLVDAYKRLDYQAVQGENISTAKREIEETMDTINLAFENLLDDLFQDMAMDISTDISVLETILAQEGLTENNMRIQNKNMEDEI